MFVLVTVRKGLEGELARVEAVDGLHHIRVVAPAPLAQGRRTGRNQRALAQEAIHGHPDHHMGVILAEGSGGRQRVEIIVPGTDDGRVRILGPHEQGDRLRHEGANEKDRSQRSTSARRVSAG